LLFIPLNFCVVFAAPPWHQQVDLKDLRPAFLRLLPSFSRQAALLPARRAALQLEVRAVVEKYGPELGEVYTEATVKWDHVLKKLKEADDRDDKDDEGQPVEASLFSVPTLHVDSSAQSVESGKKTD
jgi:hypothetical protein